MIFCEHCGSPVQSEARFCRRCGIELSSGSPVEESERILQTISAIPFETRDKSGFWKSFWETWKGACLHPAQFYPSVGDSKDSNSALIFFVIASTLGAYLSYLLSLPFRLVTFIHFISILSQNGSAFPQLTTGLIILFNLLWLLFIPLVVFVGLLLSALFTHLFLLIVGGAPKGFGTTLRTMAYAGGANLIPAIGWIWTGILILIGLAKAHRTEAWRPVVALLLELFVSILLILIPITLFFTIVRNYQH